MLVKGVPARYLKSERQRRSEGTDERTEAWNHDTTRRLRWHQSVIKTHRSTMEYHHQGKCTPAPATVDWYFAWHVCMRPVLITNNLHEIQKNMQSDQVTKKDADMCLVWTYGHYACSIEWVGMAFCQSCGSWQKWWNLYLFRIYTAW